MVIAAARAATSRATLLALLGCVGLGCSSGGADEPGGGSTASSSDSDSNGGSSDDPSNGAPTTPTDPGTGGSTADTVTATDAADESTEAPALVPAREEDVMFAAADGLELAGSLIIPEHFEGEQNPAVVLVHGSGPHDRNQDISLRFPAAEVRVSVLRDLAARLGEEGYVVLRYDKRSCGSFNNCGQNNYPTPSSDLTTETFLEDSLSAVDFLTTRPEVDAARIIYVGHSQGGGFVPHALERRPDLAAGVLLAAPHRPIDVLIAWQAGFQRQLAIEAGASEAEADAAVADLVALADNLAALRAGTFRGATIGGSPTTFWSSWMQLGDDAPAIAQTVSAPMLVLSGDYDWNVPPEDTALWTTTLGAGMPESVHESAVLPCISHAMNCISNEDWTTIGPRDLDPNVAEAVFGTLVPFLQQHSSPR